MPKGKAWLTTCDEQSAFDCPMASTSSRIMTTRLVNVKVWKKGRSPVPRKHPQYANAAEAVSAALDRERAKRSGDMKPIELVKYALAAYLAFVNAEDEEWGLGHGVFESNDSRDLRHGTKAAVDRMLFNANYWRAAYETRIVEACDDEVAAKSCVDAITVWTSHPLRLNRLSPDEAVAVFERFQPPFAVNKRRGSQDNEGMGRGPLSDLRKVLSRLEKSLSVSSFKSLDTVACAMESESRLYETLAGPGPLDVLFVTLPAWCLQNRIKLVNGTWWDDSAVMGVIIDALHARFLELGFGDVICRYFYDSCYEALDVYHHELSADASELADLEIPELVSMVVRAREACPSFETDGYGDLLPSWLIGKEQLIWNILVCSLYGPVCARPLLADSPNAMLNQNYVGKTDVITELASALFIRYIEDRTDSAQPSEFATFASMPTSLRDSNIAFISSIPSKLSVLGYEVMPLGSCYPDRRVSAFTESEIECLAILEHRRWVEEREKSGWMYGESKDVEALVSPYLVPWEELTDRVREWNRSAVRSIPGLLASVNLAIVR